MLSSLLSRYTNPTQRAGLASIVECLLRPKNRMVLLFGGITAVFAGLSSIVLPYLSKLEIDQLASTTPILGFGETSFGAFGIIIGAILVLELFFRAIDAIVGKFESLAGERIATSLSLQMVERYDRLDIGYLSVDRSLRVLRELRSSSQDIPMTLVRFMSTLIKTLITGFGVVAIIGSIHPGILVLCLVAAGLSYCIENFLNFEKLRRSLTEYSIIQDQISDCEWELQSRYAELLGNGAKTLFLSKLQDLNTKKESMDRVNAFREFWLDNVERLVAGLLDVGVKISVGYAIFFMGQSIGLLVLTTSMVGRLQGVISEIFRTARDMQTIGDSLTALGLFMSITDGPPRSREFAGQSISWFEIKELSFNYPNASVFEKSFVEILINRLKKLKSPHRWDIEHLEKYQDLKRELEVTHPLVLKNISLEFESGKIYGIIGKNWAGKTTLTEIILGYYSNFSGSILADWSPVNGVGSPRLMTEMSILRQSPYLLYGRFTIRDNILLGVSKPVTDEAIYAELAHFGMDKTIRKLRKGLDTELGYDVNLSGGQKQIINFIRTIYQDRKFLIYDEGTNQLDAENELLVMQRLTELKRDRIILFVTHRMSTLKHVDMIYCLEDGTITDSGTPQSLIKGKNLFHSFWSAQHMEG